MRTFKQGNWDDGDPCIICDQTSEGEVVLIPVHGTQSGNIAEAKQVHVGCLMSQLLYYPDHKLIAAVTAK